MNHTTYSGEVKQTTPNAVLFHFDEDEVDRWVPRSVCIDGDELTVGDTDIVIKDWWTQKEGLS